MNAPLLLLNDNRSDNFFPEVKQYLNGELKKKEYKVNEKVDYKYKTEIINNEIKIERRNDIIYKIELNGRINEGQEINEILDSINSIDLFIADQNVLTIYLQTDLCQIQTNNKRFTIFIDFDKIFYSTNYLPIINIQYNDIKLVINGNINNNLDCYILGSFLENNIRHKVCHEEVNILYKECFKYNGILNENEINLSFSNNNALNTCNFISSIYFKFDKNIRDKLNNIIICNDNFSNNNIITILTYNDIEFISDNEFNIKKFNYKTFLYDNICFVFDMIGNITNLNFTLITTNYNILNYSGGNISKKYIDLKRKINYYYKDYLHITNELYEEKVKPKNDLVCAISHDNFYENEERIIPGCCFTSFKKDSIEKWFKYNKIKKCPYCKNENVIWYKKVFIS